MNLEDLGWTPRWAEAFAAVAGEGLIPGRVLVEHGGSYRVATALDDDVAAEVAGRLRHEATRKSDLPAVGDFVVLRPPEGGPAIIQSVLPRRTSFLRKAAGERVEEQVVAANIDVVLLMSGLDRDFNLRRIERYLTLAWESGAEPVLLLNKADLCEDVEARLAEVHSVAFGVPIHVMSALGDEGVEAVTAHIGRGRTAGVLGSSGVGKSTLINRLLGHPVQPTREVRASDHRGRHTTTHRELFVLPSGGMIIDTPGMRELQLWTAEEGLGAAFGDIATLAAECRFKDCRHESEPGCAVLAALQQGALPAERLESYRKLVGELHYLESQQDQSAQLVRKRRDKIANKAMKEFKDRR